LLPSIASAISHGRGSRSCDSASIALRSVSFVAAGAAAALSVGAAQGSSPVPTLSPSPSSAFVRAFASPASASASVSASASASARAPLPGSRAAAKADIAADPLCRLCPCQVVEDSGPAPALQLIPMVDCSTSFLQPPSSDPDPVRCEKTAARDRMVLGKQTPRQPGPPPVPAAYEGGKWVQAIRRAGESYKARIADLHLLCSHHPRATPQQSDHYEPKPVLGGTTTCSPSARADSYSPLDDAFGVPFTAAVSTAPAAPPLPGCQLHVAVLVTDGLWHPPGKTYKPEAWVAPALPTAKAKFENAVRAFLTANPTSAFFFAQAPALSVDKAAPGKPSTPPADVAWDVCQSLPEALRARCGWTNLPSERPVAPATAAAAEDASAAQLQRDLNVFLSGLHCGRPTLERYHAVKTRPKSTFDDAVLLAGPRGPVCSGVLVAPNAVLTAKHCGPIAEARFGDGDGQPVAAVTVTETANHPSRDIDAALLRLSRSPGIPAPLLRDDATLAAPGSVVRYVGYGPSASDTTNPLWRRKSLDLDATGWGCDGDRVASTGCKPGWEMVLAGGESRDTCHGDSGGPVYELWGDTKQCGYRLIAVTSRRTADATIDCGAGGIYTRVDTLHPWIEQQIEKWAEPRKEPE